MIEPTVARSHRLLNVPEAAPEFLSHEVARRVIEEMRFRITDSLRLPTVLKDVTLFASLTNAGGAWLELNSPSDVNADTGIMEWLPGLDGSCHGELYVHLPGAVPGASYLGQLRCGAVPVYGQEANACVAVNVFGGAGGAQYARMLVRHSPLVVPFFLPQATGADAWVAFNPSAMRSWHVYDVAVRRL